jgi:hypothetical protein
VSRDDSAASGAIGIDYEIDAGAAWAWWCGTASEGGYGGAQRRRGRDTDGGGDVAVEVGGGDEADEEAALADARVPDEQDLEGALVAAAAPRTRRPHFGPAEIPPDSVARRARNAPRQSGTRGRRAGRARAGSGAEEG